MDGATLTAPVTGLVTSVGITEGQSVGSSGSMPSADTSSVGASSGGTAGNGSSGTSSTAAITIVGTDAWTVDVSVGESDVAVLTVGNQVEMTSDDIADTVFGTVSEIGKLPSTSQGASPIP